MRDSDNQKWKKRGKQLLKNNKKMKKINIDVMYKLKCNLMSNKEKHKSNTIVK